MSARRGRRASGLLALALLLPLPSLRAPQTPEPAPPQLTVEVAGCAWVAPEAGGAPACELPEGGALALWIRAAPASRVGVRAGGEALTPASSAPVQGGERLEIRVPAGAAELSIEAERGGAVSRRAIPLRPATGAAAVSEAERLRKAGALDQALSLLEPEARAGSAAAEGSVARILLQRGDVEGALRRLEAAAARHRAGGRLSDALRDELALAHALIYRARRLDEARRALDRAGALAGGSAEARIRVTYYEALLAYEAADVRAALPRLSAVAEGSERLGLASYRAGALPLRALLLQALGRDEEAEASIAQAHALAPALSGGCERAELMTNVGWFHLRALGGGSGSAPGEAARARAARAEAAWREVPPLFAEGGRCPQARGRAVARINLALLALALGRPGEAGAELAAAEEDAARGDAKLRADALDLRGRLALHAGDAAGALRAYDQLEALVRRAALPAERPRASLGRARALAALGRDAGARAAFADAEASLEELALLVPIDAGRASFLARFEEAARAQVAFLLPRDPAAAAAAARRSRARALASLRRLDRLAALTPEERARWEQALAAYRRGREALEAQTDRAWALPEEELRRALRRQAEQESALRARLDEALAVLGQAAEEGERALPEPAPGELLLVYHPLPEGWAGFAVTAEGARGIALGAVDAGAPAAVLGEALLEPFASELEAASRARLLAYGALDRRDLHALPWRGRPLVAALPVAYGLDLSRGGARGGQWRPPDAAGRALIVADPGGDLPAARREGAAVAAALAARPGLGIERLEGSAATLGALRAALEVRAEGGAIDLLHYAGHGVAGGPEGLRGGLPLAGGGALTVGDVLTLERAPAQVVLSACDTARAAAAPQGVGLGLAQAFLLAGSDEVVAATRPVDDGLAGGMIAALYAARRGNLRERLRGAQVAVLEARGEADWAGFRVLVP